VRSTSRDDELKREIARVWRENFRVYGADNVWTQLNRGRYPAIGHHAVIFSVCLLHRAFARVLLVHVPASAYPRKQSVAVPFGAELLNYRT
jgi:hypothetical protein